MKLTKLFPLLVLPLSIVGCGNNAPTPLPENKDRGVVEVKLAPLAETTKAEPYSLPFNYDINFFDHSATTYDHNLMMLSFGASISTISEDYAKAFFNRMFDEVKLVGYEEITKDTIGICLAHRVIDDYDLYAVTLRGFNYGAEWANNFDIGLEGNHHGFSLRADEVCNQLAHFKNQYHQKEKSKVWLTGYSRGGGVANVMADILLRGNVIKDDLYVYTFEAPKGFLSDNAVEYENVFNLVDSHDPITYIAPGEYGFSRCGQDLNIYSENYREYVKEFDPELVLKTFTPDSGETPKYTDEMSFLNHFIDSLLEEFVPQDEDEKRFLPGDLSTREHFYNNYQPHIDYLIEFYMGITEEQMNELMSFLQEGDNLTGAFMLIATASDEFYKFIAPKLDEFGITYDSEKFLNATLQVGYMIQSHRNLVGEAVTIFGINQAFIDNVMCLAMHHFPEIAYCSLKNFVFSV